MITRLLISFLLLLASSLPAEAQGGWRSSLNGQSIFDGTVARPNITGTDLGTTTYRWDAFLRNVDISGSFSSTGPLYVPVATNCSAGFNGYSFTGDTDTGHASVSANTLSQCIAGSEATRLSATSLTFNPANLLLNNQSATIQFGTAQDITLSRSAAAVLGSNSSIAFSIDAQLRRATSDAADNGDIVLCGGGACAASRGAYVDIFGNENGSSPGKVVVQIGNVAGAELSVLRSDGTESFSVDGATGSATAAVAIYSPFHYIGTDSTTYIKRVGAQMYFGTNTNDAWLIEQAPPHFGPADDDEVGFGAKTRRVQFGYFKDEVTLVGYASGAREASGSMKQVTFTVALSGATTATATSIPAGATVEGVAVTTTTTITGASGFTVGDGSDADRYGDVTGTAVGTNTDATDYTADPRWWANTARAITLTAKTSNFTGGVVQVTVLYTTTTGS